MGKKKLYGTETITLYNKGHSMRTIAKKLHISRGTVYNWLHGSTVTIRKNKGGNPAMKLKGEAHPAYKKLVPREDRKDG